MDTSAVKFIEARNARRTGVATNLVLQAGGAMAKPPLREKNGNMEGWTTLN